MQKYNYEFFYPHLGETFEYTELGYTDTLRCIMVTDRHPCFFSSPTGGCARCSCPLTCDCTNVNGYKVQFTPVSMLTEKDDLYVILTRYYFVGRGWGEWHDTYPYKVYNSKKEAETEQRKLLSNAGDCTDYKVLKLC